MLLAATTRRQAAREGAMRMAFTVENQRFGFVGSDAVRVFREAWARGNYFGCNCPCASVCSRSASKVIWPG